MPKKRIVTVLPTMEQLERSQQQLAEASTLPGLVSMSNTEKRRCPTMAEGSELVSRKLLAFMNQHPEQLSPRLAADTQFAMAGLAVMERMRELSQATDAHGQHLHDTHHALGHFVRLTALEGYELLKKVAQDLGLHELLREIAAVFAQTPQTRAKAREKAARAAQAEQEGEGG